MFRLIFLLALMPNLAAAEWSPRPAMFSYEATFDLCTADPASDTLVDTCLPLIAQAYVLKRAVTLGAFHCATQTLETCAAPFEDEGLPHIAVRIAVDAGCDAIPFDETIDAFDPNHCVTVASDIMIDEGIVPLDTGIGCDGEATECRELAMLHASLWMEAADALAEGDPTIEDLQMRNVSDCFDQATTTGVTAELTTMGCIADRAAALWADLSQTEQAN